MKMTIILIHMTFDDILLFLTKLLTFQEHCVRVILENLSAERSVPNTLSTIVHRHKKKQFPQCYHSFSILESVLCFRVSCIW